VGMTVNYGIRERKELQAFSEWRDKEEATSIAKQENMLSNWQ